METTELNRKLIAAGLNSQQCNSKTAEVVVDVLAADQGLLLAEAKAQITKVENAVSNALYRVSKLYDRHTEAIEHADKLIEVLEKQNNASVRAENVTETNSGKFRMSRYFREVLNYKLTASLCSAHNVCRINSLVR